MSLLTRCPFCGRKMKGRHNARSTRAENLEYVEHQGQALRAVASGAVLQRDPRTDPQEGDVLHQANGTRQLLIDKVDGEEVAYRVTDGHGGLLGAYRTSLLNWRKPAPYTCDEPICARP